MSRITCFLVKNSSLPTSGWARLSQVPGQVPEHVGAGHSVPCDGGHVCPHPFPQSLLSACLCHSVSVCSKTCQIHQWQAKVSTAGLSNINDTLKNYCWDYPLLVQNTSIFITFSQRRDSRAKNCILKFKSFQNYQVPEKSCHHKNLCYCRILSVNSTISNW